MSTGFTFGAKPSTAAFGQSGFGAPTTGSITFGTPAVQNPTPFGATSQPSTGFGSTNFGMSSFGTVAAPSTQPTGLTFGAPTTTTPGFAFGATATTSAPSTGLTFGTAALPSNTSTSFGFGNVPPASTGLTFGTPATTANTGFGFGAPASTSLTFGTPASTGLTFGTPASTGLTFGTPASTGLTFGTPATTGLTFGTPATTGLTFGTPASTGLTFATTTITTAPSFGFNTPATQAVPNLGQTQTTSSTGLFGTTPFAFATPTTSVPSFNLSFGPTTTVAPTFNLTAPSTASTTGLNFGLGMTTQSTGLSFGLGGITTTTSFSKPLTTTTTTSTQPQFGLGGIIHSTPKTEISTPGKLEIAPRDQLLPNELQQTVESFQTYVKQQKHFSSDVARISSKEFRKVANYVDQVGNALNEVEKQLQNNRTAADKLKMDTAKGLQNIEMAQRTMDTPPGLQYDNIMPMIFFKELVDNFEKELQNLKLQIEYTDKYVRNFEKPVPLNSQDLAAGMRKLHETFIALAGRLQTVHSQVESQKEQYLKFRKNLLNDDTNTFEMPKMHNNTVSINLSTFAYKPPSVASGPSPFHALSHPSVIQAAAQNQSQTTTTSGNIGFGIPQQPTNTSGTSLFGNTSLGTNFGQPSTFQFNTPSNTNFQLQKPPSGNKRGHQITY
ncbi:nucleoporin p58/p45 nucleoporin-like protein 1 [Holotrichia oblita]|uniref:Nucleoporin p58/p45 nucleoporin-like protein 1 n=1 Tax=Holotrichia oblita TaxID=644536 RepID=A0ACB9T7R0_HOLOL|nr:nucleoporin p58/p45 nucleoporin-like protein 1 [Holotrichia oblita]